MTNLKLKTISNEYREGTSQFISDRLIVVIDKNTGNEINSGALVTTHKVGDLTENYTPTKRAFQWDVKIWNGSKTIKKSFSNRKESNAFIKSELLS